MHVTKVLVGKWGFWILATCERLENEETCWLLVVVWFWRGEEKNEGVVC
jgi:hypothetical protein